MIMKNEIEFESEENEEVSESSPEELSKIVSYNIANTIEVLKFKIDNNEIDLKPEFQRDFVWDINRASLFIDSLITGLPIPSIFLGKSREDETYKVIDGQQRLKSAYYFLIGKFRTNGKEQIFSLRKLDGRPWNDKTFEELDQKTKRRIRNAVLNTTVIEDIDSSPRIVHDIFHRLNTGGMSLTDQEIRNCIYNGDFNDILHELNLDKNWRKLIGKDYPDKRLRDVELILRFFALLYSMSTYEPSMREFLSKFQDTHRNSSVDKKIFSKTTKVIIDEIGADAFKVTRTVNKSVCDSIMVAIAQLISDKKKLNNLKEKHTLLVKDKEFIGYVSSATSIENSVKGRIALARKYFA